MQSTKENSFQTNDAKTQPKTRWAMWSMPEKRRVINKWNFSNLLNGNQSNKRTNQMKCKEKIWLSTWLFENENKWMGDDLDALGLYTIQELKKPSEENANQTSI